MSTLQLIDEDLQRLGLTPVLKKYAADMATELVARSFTIHTQTVVFELFYATMQMQTELWPIYVVQILKDMGLTGVYVTVETLLLDKNKQLYRWIYRLVEKSELPSNLKLRQCKCCAILLPEMDTCTGCKHRKDVRPRYCSVECQRADWPLHKAVCKSTV